MSETATVNTEHIRAWVDALRSGKYERTTGWLRWGNGYCCLGVACDISGLGEWDDGDSYQTHTGPEAYVLPNAVKEWLELSGTAPMVPFEVAERFAPETAGMVKDSARLQSEIVDGHISLAVLNDADATF